jgi:quercetin dioxygenase-like cupin family protein
MSAFSGKTIPQRHINGAVIGGVTIEGEASLRVMGSGKALQLCELYLKKGYYHPLHHHPEHESIGYVISGRIEMQIGDQTYYLEAGDSWHHPIGVPHSTRALEDSYAVESHNPLRPEYLPNPKT